MTFAELLSAYSGTLALAFAVGLGFGAVVRTVKQLLDHV